MSTSFPPKNNTKNLGLGAILGLYILVWVFAHGVSDTNLDAYADMLENYAWGQHLGWGSAKHPPLFAWITGLWFAIFPTVDTSYHVLSYLNAAVGLLGVYRFAQAIGRDDLALPAVLLLGMSFPYSTLAVKFNANAVLLCVWPWVAVAWANSIRRQGHEGLIWSVALGLLAGLAMLGKYYSGVFLLALFLTSVSFQEGRTWLLNPRPWFTLLVFFLVLYPHWQWLHNHDYVTLHYIREQGSDEGVNWRMVGKFAIMPIGYWLAPWLLCTLLFASRGQSWQRALRAWPAQMWLSWRPQGWQDSLFWFAMLPWAITLVFGITGFVELSSPWAIPIGCGFTLLWLRNLSQAQELTCTITRTVYSSFLGWLIFIVCVTPIYAWYQATHGTENYYLPRREAASVLLKTWKDKYPDVPLEWVAGQWAESALLAFYGDPQLQVIPEVPDQFPATVTPQSDWESRAGLLLCPLGPTERETSTDCPQRIQAWLEAKGQPVQPWTVIVKSEGVRFPLDIPFSYLAFEYLPVKRP